MVEMGGRIMKQVILILLALAVVIAAYALDIYYVHPFLYGR